MLLLTAKNIAIFFALATTAFCVSTIVLAVEKADLEDDLQDALDKLDMISTMSPPTTASTSPITPTDKPDPSISTDSTISTSSGESSTTEPTSTESSSTGSSSTGSSSTGSSSTEFPWPTVTVPSSSPNFPTLPTGLPNPEEIIYRLPTDIRPIKYKLYWHPDLKAKTCESTVSIQIEVDTETNLIVLHAKDLEIDSVSILNMMARLRIRVKAFYLAPEREMLFIELAELIHTATPYVVSISYRCNLDGLAGMYASSYTGENGEDR